MRFQRKETELVVLVTPRLVEGTNPGQTPPVPGERWRDPSEWQLFLEQDLGGPIAAEKTTKNMVPPRYHGQYGFAPDVPSEQNPIAGTAGGSEQD